MVNTTLKYERTLVEQADSQSIDGFGRLRTSQPLTLFDSKLISSDKQALFWDEKLESGGGITASTPTAAAPFVDFTSTGGVAGLFTRQTFRRFNYQPGKSHLVILTGVLDLSGGGTGVERRLGLFDDNNGLFFEHDAGVTGITVRSSVSGAPVDTTIVQDDWNLDTLDGSRDADNPSGILANWFNAEIFAIDLQWLSIGRVRFAVEIDGHKVYVHEVVSANVQPTPYMSTPNLPVRYQMVTTDESPASTMRCICSAVVAEGGQDPAGPTRSEATIDHVDADVADTVYACVGVRLKTTALGCDVEPLGISMLSETNDNFEWQLIHNPVVADTFAYGDLANSCVQTARGVTANVVTGGTIMDRGFGQARTAETIDGRLNALRLGAAIDGARDTQVLCVRPLGTMADIQAALKWRELS